MIVSKNKKALIFFCLFLGLTLFIAINVYPARGGALVHFLRSPLFLQLVYIACFAAFGFLILRRIRPLWAPITGLKLVYGILFLPIVLLPVLRCYFKVPYLFCRVCPRPCPWGILRPITFTSFVLLNCFGKFWCSCLCPVGTFEESEAKISKKNFRLPNWCALSSYLVLLFTAGAYFLTLFRSPGVEFFEFGRYTWAHMTIGTAILILTAAFFIPRFWCRYLCPVGTIAKLTAIFSKRPESA